MTELTIDDVQVRKLTIGDLQLIISDLSKIQQFIDIENPEKNEIAPLIASCLGELLNVASVCTNISAEELKTLDDFSLFAEIITEIIHKNMNFFFGIAATGYQLKSIGSAKQAQKKDT